MAFDDLTPNQIQTLSQLIEALNSGTYTDEFGMGRRMGQQRGFIHLYSKDSVADREIDGFTETDIQTLKEEGYITTSGGRASLKAKAFHQYKLLKDPLYLSPTLTERMHHSMPTLDIFISHSSKDSDVAASLIELLRAALNISTERIRCTSVQGYKLKGGASTDETLRREVHDAVVFIGLITEASLQSAYVLFELGARWGAGRHLLPVLASGTASNVLRGPLNGINALRLDDPADIHQIVDDIAQELNKPKDSASSYQKHIDALIKIQKEKPRAGESSHTTEDANASNMKPSVESQMHPIVQVASKLIEERSITPQIATQWLREFLTPVVNLLNEIKEKFNQNDFTVERVSVGPHSPGYTYRIDFFHRVKWDELLNSDVCEYFFIDFPQIEKVLTSFGKSMDDFEQALSKLEKSVEESPYLLKQLKDIYERLISRERISRSEYEGYKLQQMSQYLLGQIHLEISKHPAEAKESLVRFMAYTLLELDIKFKLHAVTEDLQLFQFCREISSELRGKDEAVSVSLEEAKQFFDAIKVESSTLHQQLKREKIEIARRYNAPL